MASHPLSALFAFLFGSPAGLLVVVALVAYALAMSATRQRASEPRWDRTHLIPGLSAGETDEYLYLLKRGHSRSAVQDARLASLDIQVDADLAGLGLSRDDVPLLAS